MSTSPRVRSIIVDEGPALAGRWLETQRAAGVARPELIDEAQRREESTRVLTLLGEALAGDPPDFPDDPAWRELGHYLEALTASRAVEGFTSEETIRTLLALGRTLRDRLREHHGAKHHGATPDELWVDLDSAVRLVDALVLFSTEAFLRSREDVIERQREDMLELSTPVVELWDGILGLPLIGTLDSRRTRQVMETLLERIAETKSSVAIIDISGVPTVDTLTAQHLTRTADAVRLMGAECIVSGIRPQIARTIVELGVSLDNLPTRATLAGALALAFRSTARTVVPAREAAGGRAHVGGHDGGRAGGRAP